MKQCAECKRAGAGPKPRSEFNRYARSPDGLYSYCKEHQREKLRAAYEKSGGKYNAQKKIWRKENPRAARLVDVRKTLKARYGLSEQAYREMYAAQEGKCWICGAHVDNHFDEGRQITRREVAGKTARVDHCHETGRIRGLLCFSCNIGLGKFRDDEQILLNAIRYLRASRATDVAVSRALHDTQ